MSKNKVLSMLMKDKSKIIDKKKIIVFVSIFLLAQIFFVACSSSASTTVVVTPTIGGPTLPPEVSPTIQVILTPTPEPTVTPGPLVEYVDEVAESTGLAYRYIFGLSGEDWINLIISILIAAVGIYLITGVIFLVLQRLVKRTPSQRDDLILSAIGGSVRGILVVLVVQFATERLPFVAANFKQTLNQIYFVLYLYFISAALWRLLDVALDWYGQRRAQAGTDVSVFLKISRNFVRVLLIAVIASILLNHFGINITALIAILGIGGLALSLAAQDTLADAINGFIILFDRPFRVGDRIEINELNTWGDVIEIGMRTTRIQTRDNRMVVVPNSKIGKSQIVNYSYPDPHYRLQLDFLVSDAHDLEEIRAIMMDAVRGVEGILTDQPVQALVQEIGDGSLRFRLRWWIPSYTDTRHISDKVNTAVYYALKRSEIKLASDSYDLNVSLNSAGVESPTQVDE
jgi:small-conductance mechanosensitive channel